jgi:hypothetical protein
MKKVLVSLMLVLFTISVWSQELAVGFQYGFEGNSMLELHNINSGIMPTIPFDTKVVSDFPGYWYYQPSLKIAFKKFGVGLNYSSNSTGSRISGKDYSGEFRFDMRLRKNSPGVFIEYYPYSVSGFRLCIEGNGGLMFSSLHLEQNLIVNSTTLLNDSYDFKAKNYFFQPGLKAIYRLNSFEFEFTAAYLLQFGDGTFYNESDRKLTLNNSTTGAPVKPEWTGFKVGAGINFILIKSKSDKS